MLACAKTGAAGSVRGVRPRPVLLLSAVLVGLTMAPGAVAKKPPLCTLGRFLVQGEPLLAAAGTVPQPVVLGDGKASIADVCPPTRARLTRAKKGTIIAAKWQSCFGVEGRVKLKGTIEPTCAGLQGTITAKKADVRQEFAAQRSTCGDQVFDPTAETCDANLGCPADQHCTASCACEPGAGTTSTTVFTVPTTTTTCTASVTFDGATAPDYLMFSGMETSRESEYDGSSHCTPVTTPVRTGRRACQIPLGSFSALRPQAFSETALFVRIYHRIDVTTAPSTIAYAPVIVTDVLPQGITSVDVGVEPDGKIVYRLRNRKDGVNLGESSALDPGVFRRIELGTRVGASTGYAELRIDGEPVATVTNQDFGTTPLDTVFLSNNPAQYDGAFGGVWTATFDDIAMTRDRFPGEGRVVARQGREGTPSSNDWTLVGTSSIAEAWSDTPQNPARRAETPASGDPLAQTMLVAPFGQGTDPICVGNVVKACQTWLSTGIVAEGAARSYAIRRRIGGATTDVTMPGACTGVDGPPACLGVNADLQSDALESAFWSATLDELNTAEVGAVKSGGAGGAGLKVLDAWLNCEYQ